MTSEERLGLAENLPRLRASRLLEEAQAGRCKLNADGWFDVTLAATGSHEAAEEAHNAYARACLKRGVDPYT